MARMVARAMSSFEHARLARDRSPSVFGHSQSGRVGAPDSPSRMLHQSNSSISRAAMNYEHLHAFDSTSMSASVMRVVETRGRTLDPTAKRVMERSFDRDFSDVRIHDDADAKRSATDVQATAYALTNHIVMGGASSDRSPSSYSLLAHELAHVVQQETHHSLPDNAERLSIAPPDGIYEREAHRIAAAPFGPRGRVHERSPTPFLGRTNAPQTQAVLRTGNVRGSGLQFFPLQLTRTRIGPVAGEGGLVRDAGPRLSVIVGQSMTLRRIAELLLPLWNTAEPFTPAGAASPLTMPIVSRDDLARGLLAYNQYYLAVRSQPSVAMAGFSAGLRLPLPLELDATGEGVVNSSSILAKAASFDPAWEPLLDQPATAVTAPTPADLRQQISDFQLAHPDVYGRGMALSTMAITNAAQAAPVVREVFSQASTTRFELALAFMDELVTHQVALMASERSGADILAVIRAALAAAPPTLTPEQQASLSQANRLLGQVAAVVPRETPFLQPTGTSPNGVRMIADFEGFCANLYDDGMPGCGRGVGNSTIGFGHLIHLGPTDGRASEAPFRGGITRQQGEQLLAGELAQSANRVRTIVTMQLSQQQFDALVSFDYNTGQLRALLHDLNAGNFNNIPAHMNQFVHGHMGAAHPVMPGLVARRTAEGNLFSTGQYPP